MATETKTVIRTEKAPAPFQGAPYSQAIQAAGFVFVSGQLGLGPDHSEITITNIRNGSCECRTAHHP